MQAFVGEHTCVPHAAKEVGDAYALRLLGIQVGAYAHRRMALVVRATVQLKQ